MFQVIRYKQNIVKHHSTEEVICLYEATFLQFVGDNTDHNLETVDGKNTHHGLVPLLLQIVNFQTQNLYGRLFHVTNLVRYSSNKGIEIKEYNSSDVPALARTIMRPVS